MKKTINIIEDLHKGIDLKELATKPTGKTTTEQKREGEERVEHEGHGK